MKCAYNSKHRSFYAFKSIRNLSSWQACILLIYITKKKNSVYFEQNTDISKYAYLMHVFGFQQQPNPILFTISICKCHIV